MRIHEKILLVCKEIGLEMEEDRKGKRYTCERFSIEVLNDGYWFLRDGSVVGDNWYGTSFLKGFQDEWLVQRIRELVLEEKLEML